MSRRLGGGRDRPRRCLFGLGDDDPPSGRQGAAGVRGAAAAAHPGEPPLRPPHLPRRAPLPGTPSPAGGRAGRPPHLVGAAPSPAHHAKKRHHSHHRRHADGVLRLGVKGQAGGRGAAAPAHPSQQAVRPPNLSRRAPLPGTASPAGGRAGRPAHLVGAASLAGAPQEEAPPQPPSPPLQRHPAPGRARTAGRRQVQRRLHIRVNRLFDRRTYLAVRRFQGRRGLLVDGQVGPQTWGALHRPGRRASPAARWPSARCTWRCGTAASSTCGAARRLAASTARA